MGYKASAQLRPRYCTSLTHELCFVFAEPAYAGCESAGVAAAACPGATEAEAAAVDAILAGSSEPHLASHPGLRARATNKRQHTMEQIDAEPIGERTKTRKLGLFSQ